MVVAKAAQSCTYSPASAPPEPYSATWNVEAPVAWHCPGSLVPAMVQSSTAESRLDVVSRRSGRDRSLAAGSRRRGHREAAHQAKPANQGT